MSKKFYLTTAIPYVNALPHLGFALELVQADAIARYHRFKGDDVFFLTGSDENSLKNVRAAEKEGIETKELVERNAKIFYGLKDVLNLSFNDFIRTTEERHIKGAQKLWLACQKDIYKKNYAGLYCGECETFYLSKELENGLCPEHKIKPEYIEEENYFFALSKYQKQLEDLIKSDKLKIIPETRKNEVLSFIKQGLDDFSISRSKERAHNWGIPVPGDSSQIIYVWFDALSNYINALGYADNKKLFKDFWQTNDNIFHVIGKGIIKFHAIYWPAMLMSAGLNLPKTIFVHGYLTIDGVKISKSFGSALSPSTVVKKYGAEAVRYFLLREIPATADGDFSYQKFEERYKADLANGLGNLVSRIAVMIQKYFKSVLNLDRSDKEEIKRIIAPYKPFDQLEKDAYHFHINLAKLWEIVNNLDKYLQENKPFEVVKTDKEKTEKILATAALGLLSFSQRLLPFLPETAGKIFERFGLSTPKLFSQNDWQGQKVVIKDTSPLFPRLN